MTQNQLTELLESEGAKAMLERGEGAPPEPADITFTATPADAQAMHEGTLDLSVGFMRGQVKMAGDFGTLLYCCHDWGDPALGKRSMQLMAEQGYSQPQELPF